MPSYEIVFDKVILKQLKKTRNNKHIERLLTNIFDRLEEQGPVLGKCIDSQLHLYEIKLKHPPIRLYYRYDFLTNEIKIFEFEMKTSEERQENTIMRLKSKVFTSIFFLFNIIFKLKQSFVKFCVS